ncbi:hypothetical protein VTL71DRAFT_359 [Oculimacula yallundae]|uniref:Uncharacterized protein n=1 Tax=Oculimacula yallundae TaxID=86028 RepID=A0ABR4CZW9_9HELO
MTRVRGKILSRTLAQDRSGLRGDAPLALRGPLPWRPIINKVEYLSSPGRLISARGQRYIQDGKSNYLEGAMLLGLYIIIALAFLVYPDDATGDNPNAGEPGDKVNLVARSFWSAAAAAGF